MNIELNAIYESDENTDECMDWYIMDSCLDKYVNGSMDVLMNEWMNGWVIDEWIQVNG